MANDQIIWRMIPKLSEMTKLIVDNNACVVLEFDTDLVEKKLATGYLCGNEKYIRITKDKPLSFHVIRNDGTSWGWSQNENKSDSLIRMQDAVISCIRNDYGITI